MPTYLVEIWQTASPAEKTAAATMRAVPCAVCEGGGWGCVELGAKGVKGDEAAGVARVGTEDAADGEEQGGDGSGG